jgi:hypothetical protein
VSWTHEMTVLVQALLYDLTYSPVLHTSYRETAAFLARLRRIEDYLMRRYAR